MELFIERESFKDLIYGIDIHNICANFLCDLIATKLDAASHTLSFEECFDSPPSTRTSNATISSLPSSLQPSYSQLPSRPRLQNIRADDPEDGTAAANKEAEEAKIDYLYLKTELIEANRTILQENSIMSVRGGLEFCRNKITKKVSTNVVYIDPVD